MEVITVCVAIYVVVIKEVYSCTFPDSYRGTYLTQPRPNFQDEITSMSEVVIGAREIKPWGLCYSTYDSQYIINQRNGIKDCLRCFRLVPRSKFVLQVMTETTDYCYTDYSSAKISCQAGSLHETRQQAVFLYKKNQVEATTDDANILCPFIGNYKVNYSSDERRIRCSEYNSRMDNCLDGRYLSFKFRQCNFADYDLTYKCIGHWKSREHQYYMALMEVYNGMTNAGRSFRCGIYHRDNSNGYIYLSLSSSSSCTDQLYSSAVGHETVTFLPEEAANLYLEKDILCRFPSWSLGQWQDLWVNSKSLYYDDCMQNITTYCFSNGSYSDLGIYLIKTVDSCGKETYKCIWLTRRSPNVVEYQLGKNSSERPVSSLCTLNQFDQEWKTKARIHSEKKSSCPLFGDYRGKVPDTDNICAQLSTECNQTHLIRYQVKSCTNPEEIYEDQRYQCHGSWEDGGFIYTYTSRKDSKENQCFVGRISKYGKEIVIDELGDNCYRKEQPLQNGMKMYRQASCARKASSSDGSTFTVDVSYWKKTAILVLLMIFYSRKEEN